MAIEGYRKLKMPKDPGTSIPKISKIDDQTIIRCTENYRREADDARRPRLEQNKINFACYNLKQDFSHKIPGQSQEFLPKMAMAVEQSANFIQQGLTDIGEWWRAEPEVGLNEDMMKVKPSLVYTITERQLQRAGFMNKIGEAAKLGLIGSLMIAKVGGRFVTKPIYRAESNMKNGSFKKKLVKKEDKVWQLEISLIRHEDYYPDPTDNNLYELQDIWMDYHKVLELATGPDAIYIKSEVEKLKGQESSEPADKSETRERETGLGWTNSGYRKSIKITECWGSIIDEDGEIIFENVVWTIANDRFLIQKPTENPYWHGQSPFVRDAIVRVPHSVWGKAQMDAPSMLNRASNEMFNLVLDGGMMAVHGIKELNKSWLDDPSQVEGGIGPGTTLIRNASAPPGVPIMTRVDTSSVPSDGLNVLNLLNQEFNASAMTNDLRMGVASFRSVKATEVVEASQTIASMFSGIAKNIEGTSDSGFITPILQKSWKTIAQHIQQMDRADLEALIGKDMTNMILAMGPEELFADTVQGCRFRTFGISAMLNKQKDFTKLTALLQTVAGSEVLTEAFLQKYDFNKILTEIVRSLDINPYKIQADPKDGGDLTQMPPAMQGVPDMQSQIPQAGAAVNQADPMQSNAQPIQATEFPASRATPSQG
jgi:hypothetical protein